MATKRELAAEALALGAELGVEVDVERKNHAQLTELVEGLRARVGSEPAEVEGVPPVDLEPVSEPAPEADPEPAPVAATEEPPAPASPAPKETPGEPVHKVAPGKALTSLRGILGPGTVVFARDFAGGEPNLEELVTKGHVVKS